MKDVAHYIILGLGKTGRGVAFWCKEQKISASIIDDARESAEAFTKKENLPFEVTTSEEFLKASGKIKENALCVISPGVPPTNAAFKKLKELNVPIISEVELALKVAKNLPPLIAVTGTNGKTTVVGLITHILNCAGKRAEAVGNIGTPLIEAFCRKESFPDFFVVELSSFQIEHTYSPAFSIGCLLNITPNHLDWHSSMEEYRRAKEKLYCLTRPCGVFFVHEDASSAFQQQKCPRLVTYGQGYQNQLTADKEHVRFFGEEAPLPKELVHAPKHDRDNYLVAYGVARATDISPAPIAEAFATFKKHPHRIEFVQKVGALSFIDDSKSTNIASTEAAVVSCDAPIILIAGGVHKGASYTPWKKLSKKIVTIIAIGQSKELIAKDVGESIPVQFAETLFDAVQKASKVIDSGTVLLSPGCSSFDMFSDYKDRGRQFREIVRSLTS